ncbi:PIR Superfamily Protein [Plasmodium ovale wallikeri]|uniref:PIR Superfamily Protein n=1 Tax=Plasmodium ovale wallikeri TaxID=864142 RepID=A0A1A9AFK5_PLAOA|nr:PIR Superfamily Protein [Plasmodium ovale wallikeri]
MAKPPKEFDKGKYYDMLVVIRGTFNSVKEDEHSRYLYDNDHVLKNIALYLLQNYESSYKHCKMDSNAQDCCNYLNKWLNEKKSLYTSNTKCNSHNVLWEHYIEKLWEKMQEDEVEDERCNRDTFGPKYFHEKWLSPSCSNDSPVDIPKECPEQPSYKKHECPPAVAPTSSSCKTVLTTTYVVFGILLFFMYLLRFSSVGMKLNNLIRGKKIKRRNMDNENNEAFRGENDSNMDSLDTRFNVIYNSFQN